MEKKQKTLSLLLAAVLCSGSRALAEAPYSPAQTLDVRPVLTQVPLATQPPGDGPVLTQQPPAAPAHSPVATQQPTPTPAKAPPTVPPATIPERTQTPLPAASTPPAPVPHPTAVPQPETSQKPVVATPAPSTDDDYTTGYVGMQEENAFLLLNRDRAANGLGPLVLDPALCSIARAKSADMRDHRYFAHESPTWGNASQMLKAFGYSAAAVGENIAHHATVEKSQAAFMSSPGHRRNILSKSWTKVGIGVVTDAQGFVYVTQLFVR